MPDAPSQNGKRDRAGQGREAAQSLAPTGLRAAWRGFRTTMSIGFQAYPALFVFLFSVETVSGFLGLFATYAVKLLVDAAVAGSAPGVLLAAGGMAGARAVQSLCGHQYVNSTIKMEEKAQLLLDQRLMALSGGVPGLEHHERPDYVDELTLLRDTRRLLGQVANATVLNLRVAIQLVGGSILLARLHPLLLLLPLCGVPSLLAGKRSVTLLRRVQEANTERVRTFRHLFQRATTAEAGKELRLFGLADELIARHHRLTSETQREVNRAEWQGVALGLLGSACFAGGYVLAIGVVLWRAIGGQATPGDVVLAVTLAGQINFQVANAVGMANYAQRALTATTRYLWLTDYGAAALSKLASLPPAPVPVRLERGITLEGVSFTYPGTEHAVLREASIHLPAGGVIALVGENGAGKTTLVKLLNRFYEPTEGRILVDGVDVRRFDPQAWRARVSAAFQDFQQFEFLVRETVGIAHLPAIADGVAVQGALARAGGDDVLAGLPAGLETQLGKAWAGGVDLSGGQWQQIALGRAFMRQDPLLVVFDEPTAAIDAPTEHALFERFAAEARAGASRGTVTLLISHRFSTVRMANLIIVTAGGRIVEQGSHDELLQQGGLYAELYSLQARAYQ